MTEQHGSGDPDVLVVDDESRLADLFAEWLKTDWDVETAYSGDEALEKMADSVEIVLLDRRMPGKTGDEVLEAIREEGYDAKVIMVTAIDPDFDIIEMGFDDYLVKPVSQTVLLEQVEAVHSRVQYNAEIQQFYSLASKRALLETEKTDHELSSNDEYQELLTEIDVLERRVDETVSELEDHDDFVAAFHDI